MIDNDGYMTYKAKGGVQGKRGKKRPMVNGHRGFLIHFDAE